MSATNEDRTRKSPSAMTLTRSEIACLALTAEGADLQAIAKKLQMSVREVEMLLYCAERKLQADNRLHAICIGIAMKLF
jgi:DNA-binding CsgD family transcriptional regulator